MPKKERLQGTCYNGVHWLKFEDCDACPEHDMCASLNSIDEAHRAKVLTTKGTAVAKGEAKNEKPAPKEKGVSNSRAIENELLAGHTRQEIVDAVIKVTGARPSGIKSQIDGILKKIGDRDGKWSKYKDVSADGVLKIEEVKG